MSKTLLTAWEAKKITIASPRPVVQHILKRLDEMIRRAAKTTTALEVHAVELDPEHPPDERALVRVIEELRKHGYQVDRKHGDLRFVIDWSAPRDRAPLVADAE